MRPLVRAKALVERFRQSLFALPSLVIAAFVALAVLTLWLDATFDERVVPDPLRTTVSGARAIHTTVATGLIAGATLVFSSILVAVQVASSQFSPRTLRSLLGDRFEQICIGVVVGTATFCLVVLLRTRDSIEEGGEPLVPHLSSLVAVVLAVASLLSIIAAVNHIAKSLQVESLVAVIAAETVRLAQRDTLPSACPDLEPPQAPPSAVTVPVPVSGWVQQMALGELCAAAPPAGGIEVVAAAGSYVWGGAPLARVWPAEACDDELAERIQGAFAIGRGRTMQEDVGFGIIRLTDVALRALSPGINDPNTAVDVISRLGPVLVALGERGDPALVHRTDDSGTVSLAASSSFAQIVADALGEMRSVAADHVGVSSSLARMLVGVREELGRRAPEVDTAPVTRELQLLLTAVDAGPLIDADKQTVHDAASTPAPGGQRLSAISER